MASSPGFAAAVKTTAAKRYLSRPRRRSPNAILPMTFETDPRRLTDESFLFADDPRALRVAERLVTKMSESFPVDVLPSGYCGPTAVPSDWNGLLNVSGCGMDPLPIPITDNATFIAANKLLPNIKKEDEPWLRELIRLFHGAVVPCDLHIRKEASTSFPYFTRDESYKKLAALQTLREPEEFLRLACSDKPSDLAELLEDYHAMYLYAIHLRMQPNAVKLKDGVYTSKPRTAPTEEEARTGAYAGKSFADMTAYNRSGQPIDGHFAMRMRDVFGLNGPLNYFLSAIWGCFRAVYLERFAFTYKVRGDEDKAQRLRGYKHVVGSDVKTMDKLIPRWFVDFYAKELTKYLDERVVEVFRRAYAAPFVAPNPWRETPASYDPFFGEDPFSPHTFTSNVGLPSGIGPNPDIGKLWMTFNYCLVGRDVGALHSEHDIEDFLLGRNSKLALLDCADDAAFGVDTEARARLVSKATTPYAVLEPETPVIYLGGVFTHTHKGIEVFPNPVTFLVNMWAREDSILRGGPVAWAEGYMARCAVYGRTPIFRDMLAYFEEIVRDETGMNPTILARSMAGRVRLTDVDAMVRADPVVLHYKVDPKDVSPEVLDEIVGTVPAVDFINHIRHLFRVPMGAL